MPAEGTSHRPRWSPLALIWGLFTLAAVGLALGMFVLPNLFPPTPAALPPSADPGPVQLGDAAPKPAGSSKPSRAFAPVEQDDLTPATVVPAKPAGPPHPLDKAPKVVTQLPAGAAYELAAAIDREIDAALIAAKVPASPLADDGEFLRRVTLDITGTIPTYEDAVAFLLDGDPHKRAKAIDRLLDQPAYGKHFANIWADLLIKRDFDSNKNLKTEPFVAWLAGHFDEGRGWDKIVTELLTAQGEEAETPTALFYLANQDNNQPSPAKLVGASANLFLGIQLQCAECHVHPHVDKWTQQDFWGMAAFFGHLRFEREGGPQAIKAGAPVKVHEVDRRPDSRGKAAKKAGDKAIRPGPVISIPDPTDDKKTVGTARAKFFEGTQPPLGSVPYRPKLASWLASTQNRYFAPAAVNRVWAHFFARGLVHPVEEMHADNAPSHPAALKRLADDFAGNGYDLKRAIRVVCNTRAYQRTSKPLTGNAEDEKLLSHMPVKVVSARSLLDSLATATGYREREPANRQAGRPMAGLRRPAGPVSLVRFFDTREYDDDPTEFALGVPQVLKLMNTNLTNRSAEAAKRIAKVADGDGRRVIEDLYLTALTRRPRPEEIDRMLAYVAKQGDAQKGYAGVLWALLNSAEFVSNH